MARLEPVFRGHMDGKRNVVLEDRNAYYVWRCHFKKDQEVELILRKKRKRRSKNQNRYLWGFVYPIIMECSNGDLETEEGLLETSDEVHQDMKRQGYQSTDEVHEAMKGKFLKLIRSDDLPATVRSTTELTTAEFADYVKSIQQWAATKGWRIPDPDEIDL